MLALVALCSLAVFQFEDRFDYPDGSEGAPAWFAESVSWEVEDGAMVAEGLRSRSFAILEKAPHGSDLTVEAEVTLHKRDDSEGIQWAVAGVAVRRDEANYWHLALVEAPETEGRRHFVELQESLDATWLAQTLEESRLTRTAYEGGDFDWQYGVPYTLRLTLSPDGIEGAVYEGSERRAHVAYRFDNRAVDSGQPALACAAAWARFDNVRVAVHKEAPPPKRERPEIPTYAVPANTAITSEATGFFYTKRIDDVWWLIDPEGRGFYVVGTDHIRYAGHWCEALGHAPYSRVTKAKYGSEEKWAEATTKRLAAWGFNTVTAGHSRSMRYRRFAHIEFLSMGSSFSDMDDLCPKVHWTGFPNVFSPKWTRHCDKVARSMCDTSKDDPWLIGYFIDNELEWYGKSYRETGLFEEAWRKPPEHTAKQAWVAFLRERVESADEFGELFGVEVESLEALASHTEPQPPQAERAKALCRDWVRLVAERYFGVAAEAIRRHDPNHLVLGSRFAGRAPDIWDIAGKHCDVVSFNMYPRIDVERGVPELVIETIRKWAAQAGKPLMITEWSFPALDSGLPCEHGAGMRVDTQEQRTKCFQHFQNLMFGLPFMVGSDFFMFVDEPELGISEHFPEDTNYGLVNGQDEPYEELTAAARALHKEVYTIHASGSGTEPAGEARLVEWLREPPAAWASVPAGPLRLTMGEFVLESVPGGWAVSLGETPLGRWQALMHQQVPQDLWVGADQTEVIRRGEGEQIIVLDVAFSFGEATEARTAVDEATGAPEALRGRPCAYTSLWRFWIPKKAEWFASQCLWVESTDSVSWELVDIFHYVHPGIGGTREGDVPLQRNVPNYYASGAAWVDEAVGAGLGCWYADDGDFNCRFWTDSGGGFHGDLRRTAEVVLGPGERYEEASPPAFFFPLRGASDAVFRGTSSVLEKQVILP